MSKFNIGDRVVPVSKSINGPSLEDSDVWNYAKWIGKPHLFLNKIRDNVYICGTEDNYGEIDGDFFFESDLIPYEEVQARIEPKEKPPVWYTLPAPVEEKIEPDYKGFYDFMMSIVFTEKPCDLCFNAPRAYAENKFIKRGVNHETIE